MTAGRQGRERLRRKIFAWTNLAFYFALHVLTRLPWRRLRKGADLKRLSATAGAEGYVPLQPDARAEFPRYMNCIHCGLCAIPCDTAPASAWDEAWTFVAGGSRSLDRAPLVAKDICACASSPATDAMCPMRVPISRMTETIKTLSTTTLIMLLVSTSLLAQDQWPRARDTGADAGVFLDGTVYQDARNFSMASA